MINDSTVTVHLLSPILLTRMYDDDLIREVLRQRRNNKVVAVASSFNGIGGSDLEVVYTEAEGINPEICSYIMGLLFLQLIALEKSMKLGYNTDSPCADGEANRVVQGIEIYPLKM